MAAGRVSRYPEHLFHSRLWANLTARLSGSTSKPERPPHLGTFGRGFPVIFSIEANNTCMVPGIVTPEIPPGAGCAWALRSRVHSGAANQSGRVSGHGVIVVGGFHFHRNARAPRERKGGARERRHIGLTAPGRSWESVVSERVVATRRMALQRTPGAARVLVNRQDSITIVRGQSRVMRFAAIMAATPL